MSHCRTQSSFEPGHASPIPELGNEPPLSVDGETGEFDHRRISVQWFSATILTGLCGAALMGGAVFAALDGEANFAASPEIYEASLRGTLGQADRGPRKADRLPAPSENVAARKTIRISTTSRVGDRELVRVRPYVRVSANLSLSVTEISANLPPFNPQKLLADPAANAAASQDGPKAAPDAAVSFVTRDLGSVLPRVRMAVVIPQDEIMARVREAANWTGAASAQYASADFAGPGPIRLAYAAEGDLDPYVGFEARIIPENVTLVPKTAKEATGGGASANERTVIAKKGDSVRAILRDIGATQDEIKAIAGLLGARGRDGGLRDGQKLRVLLTPVPGDNRMAPARVILAGDAGTEAVVALSDLGKYVSVDVQSAETQIAEAEDDENDDGSGVRLYQSLYETALRNNIPRPVIDDLIRIYSYDVDFQRRAQAGDAFEVIYSGEAETTSGRQEVLFAGLSVGGEVKRFYRFQTADDGLVDYYDDAGKSAKKFLVRKPVSDGLMRSGFGTRKHPILGYTKMHTGVDWSAPMGTPVFASGNGTIEKVGWESGYGKYIRVKHANGYETAYGHLTAYARGSTEGARVRQGQVIGFVGSTGLSTGSHVHYEIIVNGRFVDPMRVKLPRGRALEGPVYANFERERDRIDGMTSHPPARVAQAVVPGKTK